MLSLSWGIKNNVLLLFLLASGLNLWFCLWLSSDFWCLMECFDLHKVLFLLQNGDSLHVHVSIH
jgi:hypothetical protein